MKTKLGAVEITMAGMFVAMMCIGANITSIVPFMVIGGVPITLQTFFAILAGAILGRKLGAISMAVYAFVGLVGAPVFAKFSGGASYILHPTFGFIISFIFTAYVTGFIIEKKRTLPMYITAALIGMVINYLFGTNWLYFAYKFWAAAPDGFTYKLAWMWMIPPLPKDIVLAVCAGVMANRLKDKVGVRSKFVKNERIA